MLCLPNLKMEYLLNERLLISNIITVFSTDKLASTSSLQSIAVLSKATD